MMGVVAGVRRGHGGRVAFAATASALALMLGSIAMPQIAAAQTGQTQIDVDIPAQDLNSALLLLTQRAGLQIVYDADKVAGRRGSAVRGRFMPAEALSQLLVGTGLTFRFTGGNRVTLEAAPQAAGGAIQLGPVRVEGESGRSSYVAGNSDAWSPVGGYVATRSATASKSDTPILETPRSVSVITREQVEAQGASLLNQALNYTPGVTTSQSPLSLDANAIWLRGIRGKEGDTYYRDGLRNSNNSFFSYQSPEPYGLERIEVLRGPASIMFGQTAPGGIINLVSKRPTDVPQYEIELELGNYSRKQIAADLSGPIDNEGVWSYRLIGLKRDADTQFDYSKDNRDYVSAALSWRPSDRTNLILIGEYQRNESLSNPALPAIGTLIQTASGRIPTRRVLSNDNDEVFKTTTLGYVLNHHFSEQWSFRQNFRYTDQSALRLFAGWPSLLPGQDRIVEPFLSDTRGSGKSWAVDNQVEAKLSHGAISHTVVAGLDYFDASARLTQGGGVGPVLDLYNPIYSPTTRPTPGFKAHQSQSQVGIYLQDIIKIDERVVLSISGRQDWYETNVKRTFFSSGSITQSKSDGGSFTGQAGILYLLDGGLAPYASYSISFDPALGLTFDGTEFRPEKGEQYEIGLKYQPEGASALVTLSLFDLRKQNVATQDLDNPGFSVQLGEVRSRGVEFEVKAEIAPRLNVISAISYVEPKVTQSNYGNEGKFVAGAARFSASAWGDYSFNRGFLDGLSIGGGVRHVGKSASDDMNTRNVPPFTLFDMSLKYELGGLITSLSGLQLALNIINLTDKTYIGYCQTNCSYGSRRTAIGSIRYRW